MTVYHGTVSIYHQSFSNGIDLNKGDDNADFGKGFYTTTNYEQALAFAKYQKNRYNKIQIRSARKYKDYCPVYVNPMIVSYNVDEKRLHMYNGLVFESPNKKWAEFIYNNRLGIDFVRSDNYNLDRKFDYVYGSIADSEITPIVNEVKMGNMTFEEFYKLIMPYYKYEDDDQLSFHSLQVLNCLQLNEREIIRRDIHEAVNK